MHEALLTLGDPLFFLVEPKRFGLAFGPTLET
jgi:hypothetical protein